MSSKSQAVPQHESEDSEDVRVIPVLYDRAGVRFREFKSCIDQFADPTFPDWPVPGPKTVKWVLDFMYQRAKSPLGWHQMWRSNGRLQDGESLVLQHESNCRILETCAVYDQFDLTSSAGMELVARQIQIIEEKLAHKFEDKEIGTDYFLMSGASHRSQLCIAPALKKWLAEELTKESSVLKERRKAREERVLANPKKKGKDKDADGG